MNQSQRILVVDDEPQIARVLRRSLAARGYEVQVAGCGEEALEIFHTWAPDLVITDLSMPNMGGLELCRRIRAISQAPIVALSAKGEERAKVEALDAGADDYVTKPFGMDELLARIRAMLRRAPATADQQVKVLQAGDFLADLESHTVKACGAEVHLTLKESVFLLFQSCLGLEINGPEAQIFFNSPCLPASLGELQIHNLEVAEATVDLSFVRHERDVGVNALRREGDVQIMVIK